MYGSILFGEVGYAEILPFHIFRRKPPKPGNQDQNRPTAGVQDLKMGSGNQEPKPVIGTQ